MDFRQEKLRLALWILVMGMGIALIYHTWQGLVLGKGYPFNTFLGNPIGRYDDFTNYLHYTIGADPYKGPLGVCNNFPASYLLLYPFSSVYYPAKAAVLFLDVCVLVLYILLQQALQPVISSPVQRMLACVLFLWSYPVLFCLDRGNNDIFLIIWVALALTFYSQKRFTLSFLFFIPPICIKFYPALLLLLFFRRRLFHWAVAGGVAFVLVSWLALLTFKSPIRESFLAFLGQLSAYNETYNFGIAGVSAGASAWNPFRAWIWLVCYNTYHLPGIVQTPEYVGALPLRVTRAAFFDYEIISLILVVIVALDVLLVETRFPRRAMLLLLVMTVVPPGGGDYKMMYVGLALIMLLLLRERRPGDLWITGLLAFCLLPKREVLLHFMGRSDTDYFDASLGVIVNPLVMLAAMFLLVWNSWFADHPRVSQSFRKLWGIFSFAGLRRRRKFIPMG